MSEQQEPEQDPPSRIVGPYRPPPAPQGPAQPPMSEEQARRTVADFQSSYTDRTGRGAWVTAIFGSLCALAGLLAALPPTAHSMLHEPAEPIALVGTLVFGFFAYLGISRLRKYYAAKRYLREHQGN